MHWKSDWRADIFEPKGGYTYKEMHILNDVSLGSRGEGAGAKAIIPLVCYICVRCGGKKYFGQKGGLQTPKPLPCIRP